MKEAGVEVGSMCLPHAVAKEGLSREVVPTEVQEQHRDRVVAQVLLPAAIGLGLPAAVLVEVGEAILVQPVVEALEVQPAAPGVPPEEALVEVQVVAPLQVQGCQDLEELFLLLLIVEEVRAVAENSPTLVPRLRVGCTRVYPLCQAPWNLLPPQCRRLVLQTTDSKTALPHRRSGPQK